MAKNYKKDPITVEVVWQQIHSLQTTINLLYGIDHDKRTLDDLQNDDPEMYDFYYQLNDMAIKLSDREVMKFQQKQQ